MQAIWDFIMANIVPLLIAQAPIAVLAVWAWFKARAATTAAAWDDASVKFVEDVAKAIVDKTEPPAAPKV